MNFRSSITNRPRGGASDMEAAERRTELASRRIGSHVMSPRRLGWQWPANNNDTDAAAVTMLLFNVTVERTLGPIKVLMSPDKTVADLIKLALQMYRDEKRRPFLKDAADPRRFQLHYSPFSFDQLSRDEKLINLGSRNFFLCSKPLRSKPSCSSSTFSIYRSNHDHTHDYPFPFPMANLMDLLL